MPEPVKATSVQGAHEDGSVAVVDLDMSVPPISWCRIFQVGPPCAHLCTDCKTTYRATREATR